MNVACLSIRQPWASLLAWGIKPIENRDWRCAYRGAVVFHAGKTWGRDEQQAYDSLLQIALDMGDSRRVDVLAAARNMLGGFVGVGYMAGCVHEDEWYRRGGLPYDGRHEWFTGPYGFRFPRARPFPRLVPYKGQQGLFRVPAQHVPFSVDC